MAGFTSMDDLVSEMTVQGKFRRADWNKSSHATGNWVAGLWYCLAHSLGNPTAMTLGAVGTNLAFHAACDRSTGALYHGGDVGTDKKVILNASAFSAAALSCPAVFMLVDLLGWYPVTTVTTTGDQALINSREFTATDAAPTVVSLAAGWDMQEYTPIRLTTTDTLPAGLSLATTYYWHRTGAGTGNLCASLALLDAGTYIEATDTGAGTHTATLYLGDRAPSHGAGVQAFVTPSVAHNTGVPNMRLTYTSAAGGTGHLTPTTLPISNASAPIGQIEYSGTALGKFGPFMPLAAADTGIRLVEQFNYVASHGAGGVANCCLCRPLLTLPVTTIGVASERDLLNQMPSLPRIYDGACLVWLVYAGAAMVASSSWYGHLDFAWG